MHLGYVVCDGATSERSHLVFPKPVSISPAHLPLSAAHRRARRETLQLLLLAQTDLSGSTEVAVDLVARGRANGWWDVALLAEWAGVVAVSSGGDARDLEPGVELLGRWAERCGDAASRALSLATRARMAVYRSAEEMSSTATLADLVTAAVLLEGGEGGAIERVAAHVECALCFGQRGFWEAEAEQYDLALAVDVLAEDPGLSAEEYHLAGARWAIANNRAELECHWMCALYLLGDTDGLHRRAADARRAVAAALRSGLPVEWCPELEAVEALVDALAGGPARDAGAVLERLEPGTPFAGVALLAAALACAADDPGAAAERAELAVACLDRSDLTVEHELALFVTVELEVQRWGTGATGLRLARHHQQWRWAQRLASLHSMRALMEFDRSRAERETLERDARVDELTRIANRRGYQRYVQAVEGASAAIALVVIDVDHFKEINDAFGHEVGDRALQRVAAVISGQARPRDLAARMGGDEFVLILNGADIGVARHRADQIVAALDRAGRETEDGYRAPIAVSAGIAVGTVEQLQFLGRMADAALYRAKSAGGRRVVVAGPDAPLPALPR
jgi:diguanylate cyclase (GGDEF)-like protein